MFKLIAFNGMESSYPTEKAARKAIRPFLRRWLGQGDQIWENAQMTPEDGRETRLFDVEHASGEGSDISLVLQAPHGVKFARPMFEGENRKFSCPVS